MAKIANVSLSNSFDTWRDRSNQAFDRLSQFAINNSALYANTITANVAFSSLGTASITGLLTASGRATIGTNLAVSGNTSTNKLSVTSNISASSANASFNIVTVGSSLTSSGNTTLGNSASDITNLNGSVTLNHSGVVTKNFTVSGNSFVTGVSHKNQTTEYVTVSATAATGNVNFDVLTQGTLYYTTNASANWTVNIRGNSGIALNSVLQTGRQIELTFLVPQGSSAYYQTGIGIDSTTITPIWEGGSAPSSGNVDSVEKYTYKIIKTASATFTVLASRTQYA